MGTGRGQATAREAGGRDVRTRVEQLREVLNSCHKRVTDLVTQFTPIVFDSAITSVSGNTRQIRKLRLTNNLG